MKLKKFKTYLETRLTDEEISEVENEARIEFEAFQDYPRKNLWRQDVSNAISEYMLEKDHGFNDFVREMGKSPSQISKIIKGEANITLGTLAQIYAVMGMRPHITYERVS